MPITDQLLIRWIDEARSTIERVSGIVEPLNNLLFLYSDGVKSIVDAANNNDVIDQGRQDVVDRTIAEVKMLEQHLELIKRVIDGVPGITGVTNIQAQSNAIAHGFDIQNIRRKWRRISSTGRR